jgi:hypothetical protein
MHGATMRINKNRGYVAGLKNLVDFLVTQIYKLRF